jgi:endonuclease YncB( thermonuclease family)
MNKRTQRKYIFVKKIIDGDTAELDNGIVVRYIGINAPNKVKVIQ